MMLRRNPLQTTPPLPQPDAATYHPAQTMCEDRLKPRHAGTAQKIKKINMRVPHQRT